MFESSSYVNPTPLAHADISRDVLPWGGTSQGNHLSLTDGQQTTGEALTTQMMVEIEGRSVLTKFLILPKAKGNKTLLGTDFLSSAELDTPSIAEKTSSNTCKLREGENLTSAQKEKLNFLLESFQNVFELRGEATPMLEHHTSTRGIVLLSLYQLFLFVNAAVRKRSHRLLVPRRNQRGGCNKW
ncbi:retrovirus-related Pol polyprotein from transposon 17.6 [Trichonephila clavipes]|nr:retrovirus-related Pol polyprotein from transposon 17.6 [Trichonephila clavipes]